MGLISSVLMMGHYMEMEFLWRNSEQLQFLTLMQMTKFRFLKKKKDFS